MRGVLYRIIVLFHDLGADSLESSLQEILDGCPLQG
jgi:hypothetical protein